MPFFYLRLTSFKNRGKSASQTCIEQTALYFHFGRVQFVLSLAQWFKKKLGALSVYYPGFWNIY